MVEKPSDRPQVRCLAVVDPGLTWVDTALGNLGSHCAIHMLPEDRDEEYYRLVCYPLPGFASLVLIWVVTFHPSWMMF